MSICTYDFQGDNCPYDEKCMKGKECEWNKEKTLEEHWEEKTREKPKKTASVYKTLFGRKTKNQ